MERTRAVYWCALCAAVVTLSAGPASAQISVPSCPTVTDQVVSVASQQATAFTVGVDNLGHGSVSIFQYPLGGTLVPGNTATDFVFIPDDGFVGTTTFVFRVTPETGCLQGAILGKVTFVGPNTGRQFVSPEAHRVCGMGVPLALAPCTLMIALRLTARRHLAKHPPRNRHASRL
jgi:hypothetical protein